MKKKILATPRSPRLLAAAACFAVSGTVPAQLLLPYRMPAEHKALIKAEASVRAQRVAGDGGDCSGHFYDVGASMSAEPWYWHPTLPATIGGRHFDKPHKVEINTSRSGRGLMSTSLHEAMHHFYPKEHYPHSFIYSTTRNCMNASDPGGDGNGGGGNGGNGGGGGGNGGDCESGGYYSYTTGSCCDEVWISGGVEICVINN